MSAILYPPDAHTLSLKTLVTCHTIHLQTGASHDTSTQHIDSALDRRFVLFPPRLNSSLGSSALIHQHKSPWSWVEIVTPKQTWEKIYPVVFFNSKTWDVRSSMQITTRRNCRSISNVWIVGTNTTWSTWWGLPLPLISVLLWTLFGSFKAHELLDLTKVMSVVWLCGASDSTTLTKKITLAQSN